MSWLKKEKMRFSKKILIAVIVYMLVLTITMIIIYCVRGAYPDSLYLANVPPILTELIALCKMTLEERKADSGKTD